MLCCGASRPRDLRIPGRELEGIHFAMDFLTQQNRRLAGDDLAQGGMEQIYAGGKDVIVIGGGDTGADCVGTANRQGAKSVTQFEILPKPPEDRPAHQPWPFWPGKLRTSSSHEEGCDRQWSILTKQFVGSNGSVEHLLTVNVAWTPAAGDTPASFEEIPGTQRRWLADLVLLALGFVGPAPDGMIAQLGVALDDRGNINSDENYMTNVPGIFATGDARRGPSLVAWAISEGREAARGVDKYLTGWSQLPTKGEGDLPRV